MITRLRRSIRFERLALAQSMDADLIKWLNMVWGALAEEDSDKRVHMLDYAHSFLEQRRELQPQVPEMIEA